MNIGRSHRRAKADLLLQLGNAAREGVAKFNSWIGLGKLVSAKPYRFEAPSGFVALQCKTYFQDFFSEQLGARVNFVVAPPKAGT